MKQWQAKILVALVSIIIGLVVVEMGLRILGIQYPLFYDYDPYLGIRLRPGAQGYWITEGKGYVIINSDGLRDQEHPISHAADLLRPIFEKTGGVDGWVAMEVSPLLIHETATILAAAEELYNRVRRPNFFIKIPGTKEGLPAVEEAIFAGIPVKVTLLFSREHYLAAAGAFLRGIERRIAAGLKPNIGSVASIFVSRWDAAVKGKVPDALCNQLGIAIAQRTYTAYRDLLSSPRWQRANNAGARPQRLLWVGTETKDPESSKDFYIKALAAPFTINSMSESVLNALADHGEIGTLMPADGGDCEAELIRFAQAGIDVDALADELQNEEVASSIKSWFELMSAIASKSAALVQFQW